jgi:Co/Zn/Cd efflux system component
VYEKKIYIFDVSFSKKKLLFLQWGNKHLIKKNILFCVGGRKNVLKKVAYLLLIKVLYFHHTLTIILLFSVLSDELISGFLHFFDDFFANLFSVLCQQVGIFGYF